MTGSVVVADTYDVFVSYSRADWRHAADIDAALRAHGLKPFFDRRNLAPGLPWVRALEQAIGAVEAVVVLMGPHGFGNTQQYERDLAFFRQSREPAFPVVPVILPGATADRPFNFLQVLTWIDFSNVAKVSDAPEELGRLLTAVRGRQTIEQTAREALCPYRGLDIFREEDSAFFFGRGSADEPESAIGQLIRKVREHPFVMVVGRSGSGKSSLVYAGLVPGLRRERDRFWNVLAFRPGPSPLRALAAAFNPRAEDDGAAGYAAKIGDEAGQLRTGDPELLSHMIRQELDRAEGKPDRLLLYVDQWEELYAQAPPSSERERAAAHAGDVNRFIDLLLQATRSAPVTVVATVRADFFGSLIGNESLVPLLSAQQVLLGPMSRSDLAQTVAEPARRVGLAFDPPGLVQRILDDAGEAEGMLPLLQYALKETWARREGSVMTADSYARSGGVREAIRLTAERAFEALSQEDQRAAQRLFLRLVTPGEGQEDTRARAVMPAEAPLRRIVEQFANPRTRLLVTGLDRAARPTVEVAHEALIRTWPRLRSWIDANRDKLRARAAILHDKSEWEQHGRRDDLLLPAGFQLERARALLADPGDLPIDDLQEFIAASSRHEEARQDAERRQRDAALEREAARLAEIKAAQARTARLQRMTRWAFAAIAAVILAAGGIVEVLQWDKSRQLAMRERQLTHAQSRHLAELSATRLLLEEFDSALRLAVRATRLELAVSAGMLPASGAPVALAQALSHASWRQNLGGHESALTLAAFSPDGSRIVTASSDGSARIWDVASAREIAVLRGHEEGVSSAAFSPDGLRVVSASWDNTARIWDARTGQEIAVLRGHASRLGSAAFSPDGSRVVTAAWDRTVRIWDVAAGKEIAILRGHDNSALSAAFSPDGSRIVSASEDRSARIWSAADGKELLALRGHEGFVNSAAFSPDGLRIVTASGDRTARIWDARSAKEIAVLRGHQGEVTSATFDRTGSRVATASTDGTTRTWDAVTGKQISARHGHEDRVTSVAFHPDGRRIVTASSDRTARIWNAVDGIEIAVLRGHDGFVNSAAFSPDGALVVTASPDRTARIWNVAAGVEVAVLRGHDQDVSSAAFSPDGSRVVTASWDRTARVWDVATGNQVGVLRGNGDAVQFAAFSPDGSRIVTASWDDTLRIWEAATGREIAVMRGHKDTVHSVVFSPDGSRVASASYDHTARIWEVATAVELAVLRGHAGFVVSLAFSPDGARIATASTWDQTARIWDAATATEIARLRGQGDVNSVAFSADGSRVLTASAEGTVHVWDAATAREIVVLRGHGASVKSAAFSPDGSRIVTASQDGTARIWDARLLTMPVSNLLTEACRRLAGVTLLSREEMRLAGYPDSMPEIDVCRN